MADGGFPVVKDHLRASREPPKEEFDYRLAQARDWMRQDKLAGLLLIAEENVVYYTGFRRTFDSPWGWFHAALVTPDRVAFVIPDHNFNIASRTCWVQDLRMWGGPVEAGHPQDPIAVLVRTVQELVPPGSLLGADLGEGMHWRASIDEIDRLRAGLAQFKWVDSTPRLWQQRRVKTPYELDVYRRLGKITAQGFLAGLRAIRPGVTERDVLAAMWHAFIDGGAVDTPIHGQLMIRSGRGRYDVFGARPTDRRLEKGDQVMLDSGPYYLGYYADMQRQACVGRPSDLQVQLYDRAQAGFEAALAVVRAGAAVRDVYAAAVRAMERFRPVRTHLHFWGHSIGLANHEPPWLSRESDALLERGMVLTIEIPSYDIPEYRVLGGFLEDMIIVTDNGYENLTADAPHNLWIAEA